MQQLVGLHGNKKWGYISELLNQRFKTDYRTAKHCRERYLYSLTPKMAQSFGPFHQQEVVVRLRRNAVHSSSPNPWQPLG